MSDLGKPLLGEIWLSERAAEFCDSRGVFAGVTDAEERKGRMRRLLNANLLGPTVCGRDPTSKKPQTFAEAFARLYGEPL